MHKSGHKFFLKGYSFHNAVAYTLICWSNYLKKRESTEAKALEREKIHIPQK